MRVPGPTLLACVFVLVILAASAAPTPAVLQQTPTERFWIAGRYDGERIIVYFDPVKFGITPLPSTKIPHPVADGFFSPAALTEDFLNQVPRGPLAERFKLGDRYDLLLGDGLVEPFTLTTLLGFQSDEPVGNDSYIGALGTLDRPNYLRFHGDYFIARRHLETSPNPRLSGAGLVKASVPFDVHSEIAALLKERLKGESRLAALEGATNLSPAFLVEPFTIADGSLRFHVRAEWRSGRDEGYGLRHSFVAWMTPTPSLRILATEQLAFGSDAVVEEMLLAAADLGQGRTGLVISTWGGETRAMRLIEYRDGVRISQMRTLQTISYGE